jgi:NAD-dependent deacetylase
MKKLVVLTGAGISAESGLKTFRDSDGLWEGYNIEDVATPEAWRRDPALVLDFYNYRRKNVADAVPNQAHIILAELEKYFDVQIITQNIDDLHERGGSSRVLHLHGEIFKMRSSVSEDLIYPIYNDIRIGDYADDGYQLRPHIVWFGEAVPMIESAAKLTSGADLFAVVGTSLVVYPAAGLIHATRPGIPCFIVDKKIPPSTGIGGLVTLEMPATTGMEALKEMLISRYTD